MPCSVEAEQTRWRLAIERDPTTFLDEVYPAEIRRAADIAAQWFGGAGKDWVFCENATSALAGVLASFAVNAGDEWLTTSHAYGAVMKAMRLWAERAGATLKVAPLPVVLENPEQVVAVITAAFTTRTKLLVIDHISSATAAMFPVKEVVAAAHAAGIAVFVDGAHAPGQVQLDVPAICADWYTGNAHKWFFAPRGCGLLWTAPHRQAVTRPAVLSHGADKTYEAAFDWIGTRDVTPWLCIGAAAGAFQRFGGDVLMTRNRQLASEAGEQVMAAVGGILSAPRPMRQAMTAICFRLRAEAPRDAHLRLRASLREQGVIIAANLLDEFLCIRLSSQIYNETADYERCVEVLRKDIVFQSVVAATLSSLP